MFKGVVSCFVLSLFVFTSSHSYAQQALTRKSNGVINWYQFTFENDEMTVVNRSDDGCSNGLAFLGGVQITMTLHQ